MAKTYIDRLKTSLYGTPFTRGKQAAEKGRLTKAVDIWLGAAQEGDADCQLAVAEAVWQGQGALRDLRMAMHWYQKAADAGKAAAQARLAAIYATGVGNAPSKKDSVKDDSGPLVVVRDRAKARHWARLASEQGHIEAQVLLGWLCSMADDPEGRDVSQAIEWYSRAAEQGNATGMVGLAGLISVGEVPGQGPEDAYALYRRAAEQGNKTAFYYLGSSLLSGTGVTADPEEGRKWLLRAAGEGVPGAMRMLGQIYLKGIGNQPVDIGQAETWFRRGAVKGDVESMVFIADLHALGKAHIPNPAEAIVWYAAAMEAGFAPAMTAMGLAHLEGKGVPKDPVRATDLFARAADKHLEARFQLGLSYLLGRGVPADPAQAAQHLLMAAELGHPDATYNYGTLLYHGNGVPQDRKAAFDYYILSAERGSASGQFRVAHAMTLGRELPLNNDRALELFAASAAQGHVSSQINLARMTLLYRPQDHATLVKVRAQLQEPAEAGVMEAMTMLAELLWRMDQDATGAQLWLDRSAALGDPLAAYVRNMITSANPTARALTASGT
ncbi:hypothetical protein CHU95_20620 [Niveispirillum lacus]|uniref:Sel1 repeat family protein n=1 Tax=Niveispirillum lacus TaxID=1981099 RepID=A0A255YQR2_9PROT|nr:tetratricopeptide repeat protein [Niveispirillum lacus]OYQ31549.1 hypothetical protein CHU95_20620 [Niveispirillum lacus]